MSIGDHIRDLRWDNRLNQGELARRSGIAQNTLSLIELGKATPSVPTLEKIARGLGVELSDLLVEEPVLPEKAEAPLSGHTAPEAPEPPSPQVRQWLREQGATLGAMTDEEFRHLVLGMDLEVNPEGQPAAIERLVERLELEDGDIGQALSQEGVHGGPLFPKLEKGPDLVKRAGERWRAV